MGSMVNTEDPDEMPHMVAFHQGLHCLLLKTKWIVRERNGISFENYELWPLNF